MQHELQHQETMLITLSQAEGLVYPLPERPALARSGPVEGELAHPGGRVRIGTDDAPWAYDNERPAHEVELGPFRLDRSPVTNRAYLAFVQEQGVAHPGGWIPQGDGAYGLRRFGHELELPLDEPVEHVSFHEAEAFARWAGRRLPTEHEWEAAAAGGALPLVGDVWEWTSSPFAGYPGFQAFPYEEYSQDFYTGEYRVLRGGCWATDPLVARTTFRNWDYPIRRQIFAGFRTASDG